MIKKPCYVCGVTKPLTDYYSHNFTADKRLHLCKDCHKERMGRNRRTNPAVQEYDRARYHKPERKAAARRNAKRWNEKYPLAYKAHNAVSSAIRDGRLDREPCTICGAEKAQAHHKDYSKPLDVTWLCAKCHHRIHAAFPELGGNYLEAAE